MFRNHLLWMDIAQSTTRAATVTQEVWRGMWLNYCIFWSLPNQDTPHSSVVCLQSLSVGLSNLYNHNSYAISNFLCW